MEKQIQKFLDNLGTQHSLSEVLQGSLDLEEYNSYQETERAVAISINKYYKEFLRVIGDDNK